ncbi:hypothetical protein B0H13DRAFT_1867347 [Mycena leptocephala]|nr:hypothetical protein B0H13DRAFT_1867347 [Mycena leptocephala]
MSAAAVGRSAGLGWAAAFALRCRGFASRRRGCCTRAFVFTFIGGGWGVALGSVCIAPLGHARRPLFASCAAVGEIRIGGGMRNCSAGAALGIRKHCAAPAFAPRGDCIFWYGDTYIGGAKAGRPVHWCSDRGAVNTGVGAGRHICIGIMFAVRWYSQRWDTKAVEAGVREPGRYEGGVQDSILVNFRRGGATGLGGAKAAVVPQETMREGIGNLAGAACAL